jgi:hypothetical protein
VKTKRVRLRFKDGFFERVAWGKPDSPRRALCSMCHGKIGANEVPLMAWRDDGSMIQLCDTCTERWVEGVEK